MPLSATRGIVGWDDKVTCERVEHVDHPERQGGKSLGLDIGNYLTLTLFQKRVRPIFPHDRAL